MKRVCIIFLLSIIISLTALGFSGVFGTNANTNATSTADLQTAQSTQSTQYLRIHIRADSNADEAQAVKYAVRDKIVEYLTPLVAGYATQSEAVKGVQKNLDGIERVADDALRANGYAYSAKASVKREYFPTRVYGGYTLSAGEYTALIVELGEGLGDNWWCVIYPPLCFTAPTGKNIVYKSKILEIIRRWKNA